MTSRLASLVRRTDYVRTIDHLRAWPLRLPGDVKEVVLAVSPSSGIQHSGTKLFVQLNVPQLKYNNPGVKFSVTESPDSQQSHITFLSEDGGQRVVETTGLQWKEIQQDLNSIFTSPHSVL